MSGIWVPVYIVMTIFWLWLGTTAERRDWTQAAKGSGYHITGKTEYMVLKMDRFRREYQQKAKNG